MNFVFYLNLIPLVIQDILKFDITLVLTEYSKVCRLQYLQDSHEVIFLLYCKEIIL